MHVIVIVALVAAVSILLAPVLNERRTKQPIPVRVRRDHRR